VEPSDYGVDHHPSSDPAHEECSLILRCAPPLCDARAWLVRESKAA